MMTLRDNIFTKIPRFFHLDLVTLESDRVVQKHCQAPTNYKISRYFPPPAVITAAFFAWPYLPHFCSLINRTKKEGWRFYLVADLMIEKTKETKKQRSGYESVHPEQWPNPSLSLLCHHPFQLSQGVLPKAESNLEVWN